MHSILTNSARFSVLAVVLGLFAAGCGSGSSPVASNTPLEVFSDVAILNLTATNDDPGSYATCQTGASVILKAYSPAGRSADPSGQPLTYEWHDMVDYGDGELFEAADYAPNPMSGSGEEFSTLLTTVAIHYVTLTVRSRDGREASETMRITVTSCEDCG